MVKRNDFVKGVINFLTHFLSFLRQFFLSVSDLHITFLKKKKNSWSFFIKNQSGEYNIGSALANDGMAPAAQVPP